MLNVVLPSERIAEPPVEAALFPFAEEFTPPLFEPVVTTVPVDPIEVAALTPLVVEGLAVDAAAPPFVEEDETSLAFKNWSNVVVYSSPDANSDCASVGATNIECLVALARASAWWWNK